MNRKRARHGGTQASPAQAGEQADTAGTSDRLQVRVLVEGEDCPFERWLAGVRDRAGRARVLARLLRLEQGNFGDHRERIAGAVSELRIDYGPGYRVYYVRYGTLLIVLLGGGVKESQQKDIETAKALWERNEEDVERFSREFQGGPA